jgi:putative ABC transport system ATP-binding protein
MNATIGAVAHVVTSVQGIHAHGLERRFGQGGTEVHAVRGIDLDVPPGEVALIMGPSGSGKTTLLSMLGAMLRPSAGQVVVGGVDVTAMSESRLPAFRARRFGFVFQDFNLLGALSARENVEFALNLAGTRGRTARQRAEQLLGDLGLDDRLDFRPHKLSGGEKQRVAIARALINAPPLILADEPTGNLDSMNGQEVMMILHDIARDEGRSVILVTHDPRVEDVADRILWLEDGALRDRKAEPHAWVHDPVCGMRVDQWTATVTTEHAGRRYVFCSKRCRERFTAAPERYVGARLIEEVNQ